MKALVTGATGFIGGAVVKKLLKSNYKVKVFVRNKKTTILPEKLEIVTGDLRNYDSLTKAFVGVDIVVNCAAALPHHKLPNKDYWDINALGVQNVVNACEFNKIKKLIHISTVGIYGNTSVKGVDEKSKFNPEDVYARSKLEGEKIIKNNSFNSKSIIIRPTIAYGSGDIRPVFLRLFKMIKTGVNVSIGRGNNYIHTVYIDNLVTVIIKALENESALGKDFIVGDIKCPKMKDIVAEMIRIENKKCLNIVVPENIALLVGKIIGVERTVKFVCENRKYKIDKAKKFFSIRSDIDLSVGLERTYKWYKQHKLL